MYHPIKILMKSPIWWRMSQAEKKEAVQYFTENHMEKNHAQTTRKDPRRN